MRMIALARLAIPLLLAAGIMVSPWVMNAQTRELNLYSSRHYDTDERLNSDFTAQTGIRINRLDGPEDQLIERIISEGANSPADVLLTVDAGRLWRADQAKLFQPIRSEVLESRVPAHLRDPEGHWFGLSKRARVLIYA